jgi:hypothetical protein
VGGVGVGCEGGGVGGDLARRSRIQVDRLY